MWAIRIELFLFPLLALLMAVECNMAMRQILRMEIVHLE